MKKIGLYCVVCLLLIGCGGGGASTSTSVSSPNVDENTDTFNGLLVKDLNLTKDISDRKLVINHGDSIKDQYLTVINYLRDLKIKCNDSRAEEGPVSSIIWDELLAAAAEEHSNDMNTSGDYSHDGSGTASDTTGQALTPAKKSTPAERVAAAGYAGQAGENIAIQVRDYTNAGGKPVNFQPVDSDTWISIMEEWMKSKKGHCSNIMNPANKSFGMHESGSRVDDNGTHTLYSTYWTQEFGNQ